MGVKWKTVKNNFPDVQKTLEGLDGRKVDVGCLKGSHQFLAGIHEYGCRINVTPRMRAYLHHKGLHLKKETTVIVIPERSFIRAGHDECKDRVLKQTDVLLADVLDGTMSEDEFLKTVGILLSSEIKEFATNLNSPKNHPFTIEQKGSSNPLMDTGEMIGGITYEVE